MAPDPLEVLRRAGDAAPAGLDFPDVRRRADRLRRRRRATMATAVTLAPALALTAALLVPPETAALRPGAPVSAPADTPTPTPTPPPAPATTGDAEAGRAMPPPAPAVPAPATADPAPAAPDPGPGPGPGPTAPDPAGDPDPVPSAGADADGDAGALPTAGPHRLGAEAEVGAVTAPMVVVRPPGTIEASGGAFVHVPPGTGTAAGAARGAVEFVIPVPRSATYRVWGRVKAYGPGSDTLAVELDGWQRPWQLPVTRDRDGREQWWWLALDRTVTLTPGRHRLRVIAVDPGARVDRILLTTDLAEHPRAASGPPASPLAPP